MLKPVIYWCAATGLAGGVVLMHVLSGSWGPWLFPALGKPSTDPLPIGPWVVLFLMGYLALSVAGGVGVVRLFGAGVDTRDRARWAREEEARRQLREMEQQIWLESLPDWQREAILEGRQRQAAITQEARRRLGLPEENPPC
jgi:hypothetical protein